MNINLIIVLSLGLNAVLAGGVVKALGSKPSSPTTEVADKSAVAVPQTTPQPAARSAETVVIQVPPEPFHWRMLESEDYRQYVANLRSIKCPEQTIQDIVYADLERLLAKKFRAVNIKYKINRDNASSDYWKSDEEFLLAKYERDKEGRKVHEERREALIELLGMDVEQQRRARLGLAEFDVTVYPFLNTREMAAIRDVWAEFREKETDARRKFSGYMGPEVMAEFHKLSLERHEAALKALSPQKMEEWMLRVSHTANLMRGSLGAFGANEQEFRALHKLEYDHYLKIGPYAYMGMRDPDDLVAQARIAESQKIKDAAIRQVLGEQRYSEYVMAQDRDFKNVYEFANNSGLGRETAVQVYQMKQANDAELARIAANQTLAPEQRQQATLEIQQATAKAVKGLLGEQAYGRFQMGPGRWLQGSSSATLPPGAVILPNGTIIMKKQ